MIFATFTAKLASEPVRDGRSTVLELDLTDAQVIGVTTASVVLDPEYADEQVTLAARAWRQGELVAVEGEIVAVQKCERCGEPILVLAAFECSRAVQ